jgi:hypothetical protein
MLAEKHQMYQAYISFSQRFPEEIECSNAHPLVLSTFSDDIKKAISHHCANWDNTVSSYASEATRRGLKYSADLAVALQYTDNLVVGVIMFLIINKNILHLVVKKHVCEWNPTLGLHELLDSNECKVVCVSVDELLDSVPFPVYKVRNVTYLPLRHKFIRYNDQRM